MTLFIQYCLYVLGSIHNFHIDHNAPCLPPKILHNHCLRFLLGRPRNWKKKLCKFWKVNKVHYGLCDNGELIFPALQRTLVIEPRYARTVQHCFMYTISKYNSYVWFLITLVSVTSVVVANGEIEESLSFTYAANGKPQIQVENFSK